MDRWHLGLSEYKWSANRWFALRDAEPLGLRMRGRLSPFLLAQELVSEPWHVPVACMLLNRTRRGQAQKALWRVLHRYRSALELWEADHAELRTLIASCGFGDRRARSMVLMAASMVGWSTVRTIDRRTHGMGRYAHESWDVFCLGIDRFGTGDAELTRFVRWSTGRGDGRMDRGSDPGYDPR